METTISNFHASFYMTEIHKLSFRLPHVQIIGTSHCGESRRTVFKYYESFQDVPFYRDYSERVIDSFSHQIQS